jgi:hypothetical protein
LGLKAKQASPSNHVNPTKNQRDLGVSLPLPYNPAKSGILLFAEQEIGGSPSGLPVQRHWEGVSLPSPMATD